MTILDPGPCDYCRGIGAACQIDKGKRKQRPYYYVSEEEYVLLKQIVQRHIPGDEINLTTLRQLASQRDPNVTLSPSVHPHSESADEQHSLPGSHAAPHPQESLPGSDERVVAEDVKDLHGDLGCMMIDSTGEYSRCRTVDTCWSIGPNRYRICWSRFWNQLQCSCPSTRSGI